MDPIRNPYAPGAGTPPPELAGRDEIREAARIALERTRIGRPSKSLIRNGASTLGTLPSALPSRAPMLKWPPDKPSLHLMRASFWSGSTGSRHWKNATSARWPTLDQVRTGPGPHRSGDIAKELGREVRSLGPTRSQLISKGTIWSPSHGDTAFTVPMFDEFMLRIIPGDEWRSPT